MHLALLLSGLAGGGAQRRMLTLAGAFADRGERVSLLVVRPWGPFQEQVPAGVEVLAVVGPSWFSAVRGLDPALSLLAAIPSLIRRLRALRPDVLLATSEPANVGALVARALGRLSVPVVIAVNMDHSVALARRGPLARALLRRILVWAYRSADALIAISTGTSRFVRTLAALPPERVTTICNPVDSLAIEGLAAAPLPHPWLGDPGIPVVLAVGKLKPQKDYPTLLQAFAAARARRPLRLLVLGEGDLRPELERLVRQLGVNADVAFEGFVANPFAYMARASVLVLASAWEGFSNVLLEALACGCPVVTTDCPSGPREILDEGRYGELVPVGDAAALAGAILAVLERPPDPERLRDRARRFSVPLAAERYLHVIQELAAARGDVEPGAFTGAPIPGPKGPAAPGVGSHRAAHIALFIHSLAGGGAQRRAVSLANGFAERGRVVDLVAVSSDGPLREQVAPGVRLVGLETGDWDRTYVRLHAWLPSPTAQVLFCARALGRYLTQVRPDALLSAASYVNLVAVTAWRQAGRPMPLVLRASNHPAGNLPSRVWFRRVIRAGVRRIAARLYPEASAVIAVSQGVADEVVRITGMPPDRVHTIYNPVVTPELQRRAGIPVRHPWVGDPAVPLILGVGRLNLQKDFPTLVRAFAAVRRVRPARLIILGEGPQRSRLLSLVEALGLGADVELPGFAENAPAWMARAALFVLSSLWEGLPGVLIEALAMGCPVVSTDCPSGPREILEGGRYGLLVPCQDPQALAEAMLRTLAEPRERDLLRARAAAFIGADVPDRYLQVLDAYPQGSPPARQPVRWRARSCP